MIRQIGEGDTKGGVIIPKDKFKEFVGFKKCFAWKKSENFYVSLFKKHNAGFV